VADGKIDNQVNSFSLSYLLVNPFSILLMQPIISVIVWFTNVGSIRIEPFTFINGLLMRASIRAFLIVEFTHVITAAEAMVLIVLFLVLLVVGG
jgi:hypothetical protein